MLLLATLFSFVAIFLTTTATALPSNHHRDIEVNKELQSPSPIPLTRNIGPSLTEFLEKRQSTTTNTTSPSAPNTTVELCTLPNFAGQCYNATWSVNTCVDLRG